MRPGNEVRPVCILMADRWGALSQIKSQVVQPFEAGSEPTAGWRCALTRCGGFVIQLVSFNEPMVRRGSNSLRSGRIRKEIQGAMTTLKVYARMMRFLALRKNRSSNDGVRSSGLLSLACALIAFLCLTFISSCGGGNGSITLAVTPKTASMDQGQSLLFEATLGNDTKNLGVTWQPLTGTGCAGTSCGTLTNVTSTSVTYTAPAGLTTGITVSLEAIAKANSSVTTTSTISIVLPVTFTTTSLPNGSNGVPYNQTIVTTGGVAPITYAVGTGSLPAGLKLNNVGAIIGTPSSSGTSTFTINAIDDGTPPLTVPSPVYTVTINPPPPLSITSTALSNGLTGTPYSS